MGRGCGIDKLGKAATQVPRRKTDQPGVGDVARASLHLVALASLSPDARPRSLQGLLALPSSGASPVSTNCFLFSAATC